MRAPLRLVEGEDRSTLPREKLRLLAEIEKKVLWLSSWTIHNANHLRPARDGIKVGGHQSSCASAVTLLTALYMDVLRPQDRIAVKPHASPVFHSLMYLLGRQLVIIFFGSQHQGGSDGQVPYLGGGIGKSIHGRGNGG